MSKNMGLNKEFIEKFKTEFIEPVRERKESVPLAQRVGNAQYKKIAINLEFMEMLLVRMQRSMELNEDFMAMAETIYNKMDKFKIGVNDNLHPKQKEELAWIKEVMNKIKTQEDYI